MFRHVDAEEIGPRRDGKSESEFLDAEQQSEAVDFGAAKDCGSRDFGASGSLLAEFFGDERERDAGEKDEKWSGKRAAELRIGVESGFAILGREPGVVAMRLEHEQARKAAHPVDVGESACVLLLDAHSCLPKLETSQQFLDT